MRSIRRRWVLALAIWMTVSGLISSCNKQPAMDFSSTTARSIEVQDTLTVKISSFYGNVTVRSGSKGLVQSITSLKASTENDLGGIVVDYTQVGQELLISAQNPSDLQFVSASFDLVVPPSTKLAIDTAGDIRISGITGGIDANAAAGDLEISWSTGEINGEATGDVFVVGSTGNIMIEASDGAEIYDTSGFLRMTVAHDIKIERFIGNIDIQNGSGAVLFSGELDGDNEINVGTGDITLTLLNEPALRVDLATDRGQIESMFLITGRVDSDRVIGSIGKGDQGTLFVRTGKGDIMIADE